MNPFLPSPIQNNVDALYSGQLHKYEEKALQGLLMLRICLTTYDGSYVG